MTSYIILSCSMLAVAGVSVILVIVRKGDFAAGLKSPLISFFIIARERERAKNKRR